MPEGRSVFKKFFSSVELTIALLVMICVLLIMATIIPQQEASRELLASLTPQMASFLKSIQVFDLYHSVWLFMLFALLSVNLVCCSWDRLPAAWWRFRGRWDGWAGQDGGLNAPREVVLSRINSGAVTADVKALLEGGYRLTVENEGDGVTVLRGERGRIAHLGVYMVHGGVLVLVLGFAVGAFFAMEGYVNIVEGETVRVVDLKGGHGFLELPFSIRCERFILERYEDGTPKTYRSDITFLKDGVVVHQGALLVNHPLSFAGYRFYQASYGIAPDWRADLEYRGDGGRKGKVTVSEGETFYLPEGDGVVEVLRVEDNLMHMGPAVKLLVSSPKQEASFWVFKDFEHIKARKPLLTETIPLFDPGLFKPYVFTLNGINGRYYTGIQMIRDPGVSLVALGGVMVFCGLIVAFFIVHRYVVVCIVEEETMLRISLKGWTNRRSFSMDKELQTLVQKIKALREGDA